MVLPGRRLMASDAVIAIMQRAPRYADRRRPRPRSSTADRKGARSPETMKERNKNIVNALLRQIPAFDGRTHIYR